MDARDFDVVARIVGSACTRRRTLKTLGAALLVALGGGRLRFEALAADLGCCKCSGTKACEMDVASYGECKQLCGTKQAIFSPNHSCQPGTSIPHVCKRKDDAAQALLTADQPGVYDLAYFSAAAADALGPHTRDDSALFFTPDAAIADGFVREQGASVLYDGGMQVYHDFNRIDGTDIAVISLMSQHASIDAAEAWRAYAQPQLWPPDAELLAEETSGVDVGALARFQFPSTETEGETVTRLTGIARVGEFVHWFIMDGVEQPPDGAMASRFQEAVVDAIVNRPDETESLAPLGLLPDGVAGCFDAALFGDRGAAGVRAFVQQGAGFCDPPKLDIAYPVMNGVYSPRTGTPPEAVQALGALFEGTRTSLTYTYTAGNQQRTLTITRWDDHAPIVNGGAVFFERLAALDAMRGIMRAPVLPDPGGIIDAALSAFAFNTQSGTIYGAERTVFAPPFSISVNVTEPGPEMPDLSTWDPRTDPIIQAISDQLASGSSNTQLTQVQTGNELKEALRHPIWGLPAQPR